MIRLAALAGLVATAAVIVILARHLQMREPWSSPYPLRNTPELDADPRDMGWVW